MAIMGFPKKTAAAVAVTALVGAATLTAAPKSADARIDTGAAVGIGIGSFALGTALGATARPYGYGPYGYAPYYAPAPVYYPPPAPAYYPPARSCWDPYYQRYYGC